MSDAELVLAYREGQRQALATLYQRHASAIAGTARARGAPPHAVADVVQETFVRAMARIDSLREPDRFRSWVLAIARNVTTDLVRGGSRLAPLDGEERGDVKLASTEPTPAELAELRELSDQVAGCLAGMSRRDATALTMVSQLGFSTAEVAQALGTSPGATSVLIHRARRRLHTKLRQIGTTVVP